MDPFTIAAIAGGAQALGGIAQNVFSGRKKAARDMESFAKSQPLATESKSINDYYQRRLNAANENVYTSAPYLISKQEADRKLLGGINALQDRKGGIGGIGKLDLMRTDALNQAIRNAESVKGANISGLGQAAQMKSAQDKYIFDVNQMTPYNRMFGLKQYAAQAANDRASAGLQMAGSALGGIAQAGIMAGYNKTPTTGVTPDAPNLTSYNTPVNTPVNSGWGANNQYGLYNSNPSSFTSANPSAFGTAVGMFNKNPLAGRYSATKAFKPFG